MKTSVVIVTRNNIGTIEECLGSLAAYRQQGHIGDIVVVDAESTDGTREIIQRYQARLLLDGGSGPYPARNIGWRRTGDELVMFLDIDDCLQESFFRGVGLFKEEGVGIVGCLTPRRRQ
jgi:glycosyltransferase involved in cell wall biosynthesis